MFGHPSQHAHMMAGVAKAAKSSKTPAHLKQHLENRMSMAYKKGSHDVAPTSPKTKQTGSTYAYPGGNSGGKYEAKSAAPKGAPVPKFYGPGASGGMHAHGAKTGGVGMPKAGGSAPAGNSPKTGAKPQYAKGVGKSGEGSAALESQVKASPAPFANPKGVANLPAPVGPNKGLGSGKSPNSNSVSGSKPPKHPPTAPTGGYKPKKNFGPVGNPRFYGG